jgi:hypothetical protein
MTEFRIRICAQDCLCKTLSLITEGIDIIAYLPIAKYDTHAATLVGLRLAKDTDAGSIFLKCLFEIIGQQ